MVMAINPRKHAVFKREFNFCPWRVYCPYSTITMGKHTFADALACAVSRRCCNGR